VAADAPERRRPSCEDPSTWVEGLFDDHVDTIYAYLSRRLGSESAQDAASEVFRLALEHERSFDPSRGTPLAWLYGIAGNVVRRHWRTEKRHLARVAALRPFAEDHAHDGTAAVDDRLDSVSRHAAVMDAVAALPDADRELLVLFAWENQSYRQIASVLSVPVGTVRSRLHRIRRDLQASTGLNGEQQP
jgi:RNA polymerase sigma factor (sigma-70 family)